MQGQLFNLKRYVGNINLRNSWKTLFKAALPSLVILLLGANASDLNAQTIPRSFSWTSTGPTHQRQERLHPRYDRGQGSFGRLLQRPVYCLRLLGQFRWRLWHGIPELLQLERWPAPRRPISWITPPASAGYHTAPQVFYFAPQNKWYLIFQSGQPQYSTNSDPTQPQNWTTPTNFFASQPSSVSNWIDFWIISDSY